MAAINKTWTWNNPHSGLPSHSMRARFNVEAEHDNVTAYVTITNIQLDGWNRDDPDPGTTQDHIVLAKNLSGLPPTVPAPPRPMALPWPSDLASRGGFAELATYLNNANPQRYFWSQGSTITYTVPYVGPSTKVVYGWASAFRGSDIKWSPTSWNVRIDEIDYRPGMHRVSGSWQSHNRGAGKANKRQGGSWQTMRTQDGPNGTGNPPSIRRSGTWRNQSKIGNNAG